MSRQPIEAVVFDWGGTLADHAAVELADMWRLAAGHIARACGEPAREDEIAARLAETEQAFWATTATHQRAGTLRDLLSRATAELGVDVTEALLEEAAVRHLDSWTPHIVHDPAAPAALAALRARGLRIGLLSNTHWPRAFHERFLARDGLADLIDARCYTSEMAFQKPHPSAFHEALAALGVSDPARAVFVGDRPWDDVYGSQRVGMRGVLRHNPLVPGYEVRPDAVIEQLDELAHHLDRWQGGGAGAGRGPVG